MSKVYRLSSDVRQVIQLLPLLAGAARTLRGMGGIGATSSNGVQGTLQPNGYIQYAGGALGLPFDVFAAPGQPVYGPNNPPPGVTNPSPVTTNADGTHSTSNAPPAYQAAGYNASGPTIDQAGSITPEVLTDDYARPADPAADTIGKSQGDTFTFNAGTIQDLLQRAGEFAPWYVWAAGGGALVLCGVLIHHDQKGNRRR